MWSSNNKTSKSVSGKLWDIILYYDLWIGQCYHHIWTLQKYSSESHECTALSILLELDIER